MKRVPKKGHWTEVLKHKALVNSPCLHIAGCLGTAIGKYVKKSTHSLLLFKPCLHHGKSSKAGSPSDIGAGTPTNESASGFTNWPYTGAFYFRWEKLAGVGNAKLIPITHTWSIKEKAPLQNMQSRKVLPGIECFKAWWITHTYERERLLLEPSSPLLAASVRWLNYLDLITSLLTQRLSALMPCL